MLFKVEELIEEIRYLKLLVWAITFSLMLGSCLREVLEERFLKEPISILGHRNIVFLKCMCVGEGDGGGGGYSFIKGVKTGLTLADIPLYVCSNHSIILGHFYFISPINTYR